MSDLNPFAKRLVAMVREMPDELLLELVKEQLGAAGEPTRPSPKPKAPPSARKRGTKKRRSKGRASSRAQLEAAVVEVVERGEGVALADVAAEVGAPKPRVSAILRSLKDAGTIHAAGDRRFTRYGKTKAIARAASKTARKG